MTHVSFNSYASKIFENHPLVVWGLDDNLHYLSAFGNQDAVGYDRRMFYTWNASNCTISPIVGNYPQGLSHEFDVTGKLIPNASQTSCNIVLGGVATWSDYASNPLYLWGDLDDDFVTWREALEEAPSIQILQDAARKSMCVSFFVGFGDAVELMFSSIDITINYQNISNGLPNSQTVNVPIKKSFESWRKILGTFDMTDVDEGFLLSIKFNFSSSTLGSEEIWLAGFNIGYWSEVFCHEYNGVTPIAIPQNLENIIGEYLAAPLSSIFDDTNNGWAIVEDARLLAMHDGLPLVYGSINQTCLYYPSIPGLPSIVLPSNGFMTQSGKYNDSTFEFWMRIDNKSQTPFKIFGTFNSTDGLYVERGFLTLKLGSKYASHYVGKWYRPMLISIRYSPAKISLLINGEQVLSLTIDVSDTDALSSDEYIAFFCDQNTFPFEIDCIAIYPYYQSIEIAKKNFVYGQMVQKTNIIDQSYKGETVHFDFTFSKYDIDFKIPDSIKWNTGIFTNVFVNDSSISVPSYSLPQVIIKKSNGETGTLETDWSAALATSLPANSTYIHFTDLPVNEYGYLYYSTINQLNEIVKMIYVDVTIEGDGPVFVLEDKITKSYIKFEAYGANANPVSTRLYIKYSAFGGAEQTLYSHYIDLDERKKIGIDIEKFMSFYSRNINGFLNTPQSVSLYVGGFGGVSLEGNIHTVDFNGNEYAKQITANSNGFYIDDPDSFMSNNQLCFFKEDNKMKMDINVSGYWRSSIPLSFFAKYVKDISGQKFYDLDILQFNCDVVSPPSANYADADIKPYITFQRNDVGAKSIFDYQSTGYINNVIHLDDEDWENKKFYFVDGSIVYHPKNEFIQKLLIGLHVKFDVKKSRQKSIALRRLEIASICFDVDKLYPVGTRYGRNVYPVAKSGDALVSKTINPFLITKDSLSYLYLTKDSGLRLLDTDGDYERGILIPINENKAPDFRLGAVRIWLRYNDQVFPEAPKKIFEINGKNINYYAYLIKDFDDDRAKFVLINSKTQQEVVNVRYIQEDIEVFRSVLTSERWTSISLMFGDSVDISGVEGSLILFPGANYQNIGIYENSNEAIYNVITSDIWADLLPYEWGEIDDQTWNQILNRRSSQTFFVDTIPIYRSLIGTQSEKFDDQKFLTTAYQSDVKLYTGISVRNFVLRRAEPYTVR